MHKALSVKAIVLALASISILGLAGCKSATLRVSSTRKARVDLYSPRYSGQGLIGILGPSPSAAVTGAVDTRFRNEDIEITVVACTNLNCRAGVKHLRNKEWGLAIGFFRKAVADEPSDHCAYFGEGVGHELIVDRQLAAGEWLFRRFSQERLTFWQTNYESSLSSYRKACAILEEPPSRYSASRDRAEEKLQLIQDAIAERLRTNSLPR